MNPNSNETAGMQLPPPVIEQAPVAADAETKAATPEQAPVSAERSSVSTTGPATSLPPIVLPLPAAVPTAAAGASGTITGQGPAAAVLDDHDLIEKEWVNKAKQIVERNRDDPHKQSEELTVFKADYMQKHYGKSIKLSK